VPLFVWVISFELYGMGAPASSYATVGLALRIIHHVHIIVIYIG
jgi:hypothetical protein